MLPTLARTAESTGDLRLIEEYHFAADRLGLFDLGTHLLQLHTRTTGNRRVNEWLGESLAGAQLVVDFMETSRQGAATGLRYTSYIAALSERAAELAIVCEPRLAPLYIRTFPQATVVPGPAAVVPPAGSRQYVANARILREVLGASPETLRKSFVPLIPDLRDVEALRERYRGGGTRPLVGIAWWSSHHGKDLPPLESWAALMNSTDADFVSLQYGDRGEDIRRLNRLSGRTVVADPSIDQLKDMDIFAAQIAALDAVVAISCTGVHLACALGTPTIVIRDDWFRREWPVLSDTTPWHPSARIVGKDGRSWGDMFDDVAERLAAAIHLTKESTVHG